MSTAARIRSPSRLSSATSTRRAAAVGPDSVAAVFRSGSSSLLATCGSASSINRAPIFRSTLTSCFASTFFARSPCQVPKWSTQASIVNT